MRAYYVSFINAITFLYSLIYEVPWVNKGKNVIVQIYKKCAIGNASSESLVLSARVNTCNYKSRPLYYVFYQKKTVSDVILESLEKKKKEGFKMNLW